MSILRGMFRNLLSVFFLMILIFPCFSQEDPLNNFSSFDTFQDVFSGPDVDIIFVQENQFIQKKPSMEFGTVTELNGRLISIPPDRQFIVADEFENNRLYQSAYRLDNPLTVNMMGDPDCTFPLIEAKGVFADQEKRKIKILNYTILKREIDLERVSKECLGAIERNLSYIGKINLIPISDKNNKEFMQGFQLDKSLIIGMVKEHNLQIFAFDLKKKILLFEFTGIKLPPYNHKQNRNFKIFVIYDERIQKVQSLVLTIQSYRVAGRAGES